MCEELFLPTCQISASPISISSFHNCRAVFGISSSRCEADFGVALSASMRTASLVVASEDIVSYCFSRWFNKTERNLSPYDQSKYNNYGEAYGRRSKIIKSGSKLGGVR